MWTPKRFTTGAKSIQATSEVRNAVLDTHLHTMHDVRESMNILQLRKSETDRALCTRTISGNGLLQ